MATSDHRKSDDDQLHTLLQTVERLRLERHPDLDAELVRAILRLHSDPAAVEADVGREVEQLVERHLEQEV